MSHFREEKEGFRHIVIQKGKLVIREKAKNWIFESEKIVKMSLPNFNEVNIPSDSEEEDDYQGW